MSPQPALTSSPAPTLQKPVSHAIKIINPATNAEVKIEKEVSTPVLAHATPSPTPERISTPVTSASPVPSLEHKEERLQKDEEERVQKEEEERLKKEEEERLKKEEERLKKEEEERLKKEEEERLKVEEELRKKEEEERLKREEEERLEREEEERLKREEEERLLQKEKAEQEKLAAEAEAEAQKQKLLESELKAKESDDETPISTGTPATPESVGSPTLPSAVPKAADKTVKTPITETVEVNDISVAVAIKRAKFIDDVNAITYPSGINPPVAALNAKAAPGKFKYDAAFLLQFQNVVTARPTDDWEQRTKSLQDSEDGKRPSASRSASGTGRQGSRTPSMPSNPFAAMGQLGSMGHNSRQGVDMSNPMGLNRTPSFGKMGNSTAQLSNMISSMSGMRNNRQGSVRGKRPGADRTSGSRGDATPTNADGFASGTSTPIEEKVEQLQMSANRWKPRRKNEPEEEKAPDGSIIYPPDVVQRKVNSLLNKMTLEKFDKISDQILEIVSQAKWESNGRTLRQVITLTFEKATDEAHWSNMYARFCKKVQESLGDEIVEEGVLDKNGELARGGALFRKYLLSKCQEQFEKGWKVNDETAESNTEVLTEEYYKVAAIKRKGLGLVRFVGELYILDMLSEKIMHRCIQNLLVAHPSEEEVESLCGLLRTIGAKLDNDRFHREHVDIYFSRMKDILEKEKLASRIKFMIMDIFDLRKAQWKAKNADKGPKTIQEIHEEALKEQAIKELAKSRASNMRFR
ncbi:armadillo-type protein [Lipomyces orientalis]|uniref:Armadillo-type protein n=1 Tax=Lipomyces orientalis TaxID=1233043 RepID=A0ACC3TXN0_9ASCO